MKKVEAVEVYEIHKIWGRWDEPSQEGYVSTFPKRYLAEREKKRLEENIPESESWDDVVYTIRPRLVRPDDACIRNMHCTERPSNFRHLEEVEGFQDTCGEIRELYSSENFSIAHVSLKGNARNHRHPSHVEEVYYILKGSGHLVLGDEKYPVEEGDVISIPREKPHYLEPGEGMEVLSINHPPYSPDDVIPGGN
jgi:mannose-6-phosphate isomerase-like protein (cupin superfamily)